MARPSSDLPPAQSRLLLDFHSADRGHLTGLSGVPVCIIQMYTKQYEASFFWSGEEETPMPRNFFPTQNEGLVGRRARFRETVKRAAIYGPMSSNA